MPRTSRLIRFPEEREIAQTGSPDSYIDEKEFLQLLYQAVNKLPPQQRQVWRLAEEQQLEHEAIAIEMQLSKKKPFVNISSLPGSPFAHSSCNIFIS